MLDESNNTGVQKMFPVTVQIFEVNFDRIMTKSFNMNLLERRDANIAIRMFKSIYAPLFSKYEIGWLNVTTLGLDNTNANIGRRNSLSTVAREKNKFIVISGCPCHILHNAAWKASFEYVTITKFAVEDHCVDIYDRFEKSSKHKSAKR